LGDASAHEPSTQDGNILDIMLRFTVIVLLYRSRAQENTNQGSRLRSSGKLSEMRGFVLQVL
jgi:hypothetical protein